MAKRRKLSNEEMFEKLVEDKVNDMGKDVIDLAKRMGIEIKKKKSNSNEDWGFRVFGFVGPIIASIISIMFLMAFSWFVSFVGIGTGNTMLTDVSMFLSGNMQWFFVLFLFFGYSEYLSKRFKKKYWIISPFVSGIGLLFMLWIAIWALNVANIYSNCIFVSNLSNFLYSNMLGIMFVFIVLDYLLLLIEKSIITK